MSRSLGNAVVFVLVNLLIVCADFPDDPKPCHYNDTECLIDIINYFVRDKHAGDNAIDLNSLDPLHVDKVRIKQGADSPVNIDLLFSNNVLDGLRSITVKRVKGFGENLEGKHEIQGLVPLMHLVGDYKITGRVLILPTNGQGISNITLFNTTLTVKFHGKSVERNDESYLQVADIKLTLKPERLVYNFTDLVNDENILSDTFNQFLNENWSIIFDEVHNSLAASFAQILKNALDHVFMKYPYNKYFLPKSS